MALGHPKHERHNRLGAIAPELAITIGSGGVAHSAANDQATCIGENASTFAPVLRGPSAK